MQKQGTTIQHHQQNFAGMVKNDGFDGNIGIEENSEEIVSPFEKEIVKTRIGKHAAANL